MTVLHGFVKVSNGFYIGFIWAWVLYWISKGFARWAGVCGRIVYRAGGPRGASAWPLNK